jgi:prophage regulatory protein
MVYGVGIEESVGNELWKPDAVQQSLPPPLGRRRAKSTEAFRTAAASTRIPECVDLHATILRVKEVVDRTKLSRATVYVLMTGDPTFPKKIRLTARTVGFLESEIEAWIRSRIEASVSGHARSVSRWPKRPSTICVPLMPTP